MDGNGRWAKSRGLPRVAGHREGAETVRRTIEAARDCGVKYLTLFSFSSENWKRPEEEVRDLMGLLRLYLRREIKAMHEKGVRLRIIGDRERLQPDIVDLIAECEQMTAGNGELTLTLALSYGARAEMAMAAKRLAQDVQNGTLNIDDIDEASFSARLFTADMPDPDLLIRTSGEQRVSKFPALAIGLCRVRFCGKTLAGF